MIWKNPISMERAVISGVIIAYTSLNDTYKDIIDML